MIGWKFHLLFCWINSALEKWQSRTAKTRRKNNWWWWWRHFQANVPWPHDRLCSPNFFIQTWPTSMQASLPVDHWTNLTSWSIDHLCCISSNTTSWMLTATCCPDGHYFPISTCIFTTTSTTTCLFISHSTYVASLHLCGFITVCFAIRPPWLFSTHLWIYHHPSIGFCCHQMSVSKTCRMLSYVPPNFFSNSTSSILIFM